MWLSTPIYEGLPFCAMGLGLAAIAAGFTVGDGPSWQWLCICAGRVLLVAGLVIWLKRRDYRSSRSRSRFDEVV
jgi:membrane protein implicated in regulation of membrane protease activity